MTAALTAAYAPATRSFRRSGEAGGFRRGASGTGSNLLAGPRPTGAAQRWPSTAWSVGGTGPFCGFSRARSASHTNTMRFVPDRRAPAAPGRPRRGRSRR